MQRGQRIEVLEAFEGKQVKVVVEWNEKLVFVCRETEYLQACTQNRDPKCTGFPREFVRQILHEGR